MKGLSSAARRLAFLLVVRIVLNTAYRIVYPFLPAMARGMGLSIASTSRLVSLRLLPGLAAPWLGAVGDRLGRRRMIQPALGLFALAGLLTAVSGSPWAFGLALAMFGLCKILFDPSVHALIGDTVPYDKRARAIGILELSWSAAWLLGVPASGYLIQRFGWRSPWLLLGLLGLASFLLAHWVLPHDQRRAAAELPFSSAPAGLGWTETLRRPGVAPMLATAFLLALAIEMPFIVYGAWLEQAFGLSLTTLGLASIILGIAEAISELGAALWTDHFGKRRSVLAGLIGLAAALILLPRMTHLGLVAALGGIALIVLTFEFSIVSFIPLATEISPDARASFLSYVVTAMLLGRLTGTFASGWLWELQAGGVALQAYIGAAAALLAAVVTLRSVREHRTQGAFS